MKWHVKLFSVALLLVIGASLISSLIAIAIHLKRKVMGPPTERGRKREVNVACTVGTLLLVLTFLAIMWLWAIGILGSALSSAQLLYFTQPWFIRGLVFVLVGIVPGFSAFYLCLVSTHAAKWIKPHAETKEDEVGGVILVFLTIILSTTFFCTHLSFPREKFVIRQAVEAGWGTIVDEMQPGLSDSLRRLLESVQIVEQPFDTGARWLILDWPSGLPARENLRLKPETRATKASEVRYILVISGRVESIGYYRYVGQRGSAQERFVYRYKVSVVDWQERRLIYQRVLVSESTWSRTPERQDKPRGTILDWLDERQLGTRY